ncbi:phosphatidylinositol-glycan biosynthesis class F protein [Senna tora]|uniref:Phosphatidylinositol-glycan biosynthesis class F protein n=1 Tax=Senna tora TaxID=362788 RepID=A0A835CEC9_9FABA|nr:phosphatidylinositol-glycan biosynthesis class F protein [Senna tora]
MDRRRSREKTTATKASTIDASSFISSSEAFIVQLFCGFGLVLTLWVANNIYSLYLINDPSHTLFLIWVIHLPIVVLLYSRYRQNPKYCTYLRAIGRGMLGVLVGEDNDSRIFYVTGAALNFLGAVALGAPVTIHMPENKLYKKVSLYLHSLPSIEDSALSNLVTSAGKNQNDIVLSLDPKQTIIDHFLGARVFWFQETTQGKSESENRTFILKIRKADKRRILRPYF